MKSIAVTSGKGGTGKSCVAAYTGMALAKEGHKTLLLELGSSFRTLDLMLGLQDQVVFDLQDILEGRSTVDKALLQSPAFESLHLIPCGLRPGFPINMEIFTALIHGLAPSYDYILVDSVPFDQVFPSLFDMVLQVITPDSLCVRASAQQARDLLAKGARQMRLVINNVPPQVVPIMGAADFDDIIDAIGVQLIAVIPASPKLQYSANNAAPLDAETITADIFERLAGRLQGKRLSLMIL